MLKGTTEDLAGKITSLVLCTSSREFFTENSADAEQATRIIGPKIVRAKGGGRDPARV